MLSLRDRQGATPSENPTGFGHGWDYPQAAAECRKRSRSQAEVANLKLEAGLIEQASIHAHLALTYANLANSLL